MQYTHLLNLQLFIVIKATNDKPEEASADNFTRLSSPLMQIESFLEALTNANKDGRIVVHKKGTTLYWFTN